MMSPLISFITTPLVIFKKAWGVTWLAKILMLVLAYMEPIRNIYYLAIGAVLVNFVLGLYKSKVVYGESFNGKKARVTIEKIGIFTIYLSIVFVFEKVLLHMPIDQIYGTRILAGILILAELKSISENGDKIIGGKLFITLYKAIRGVWANRNISDNPDKKDPSSK